MNEIQKIKDKLALIDTIPIKFDEDNRSWIAEQSQLFGVSESFFVASIVDGARTIIRKDNSWANYRGLSVGEDN